MGEPQWTLNGRTFRADDAPPSKSIPANAAATVNAKADAATPAAFEKPIDMLLADRATFSAEEDAELQRAMARHKVDREHPVIQVIVEMMLYRRKYEELLEKFTAAARQISDLLEKVAALPSALTSAKPSKPKQTLSFVVQPTASAALYAFVMFAVAAVAWIVGQGIGETQSDARLRAAAPQVATLLTTKPGQAALELVRDNGDALPSILAHCRTFVDHDRDAKACSLWARGTGIPLKTVTPLDHAMQIAAGVPAWPVVLLLLVIGVGRLFWRSGRASGAKATRGW